MGTALETPFSPLSFGKSFMKIRSAVPENGCLIFCGGRKKKQKNICKTYTHLRPIAARMRKLTATLTKFCAYYLQEAQLLLGDRGTRKPAKDCLNGRGNDKLG